MSLYVGRIVCVARLGNGRLAAAYRVSSRSFPNRTAVLRDDAVSIVPKEGHEADVQKNPYIAYNCVRLVASETVAIVTNGSHTDPIAEKIAQGMPVRDALALSSLALDYEKDQYNTPRISAVVDTRDDSAWLAVVRDDGLEVRQIALEPGRFAYVATYEENTLNAHQTGEIDVDTPAAVCEFILSKGVFAERTNPVSAVAAIATDGGGFELAAHDAPQG